jgi:predicted transcriptional regulator
LLFGKKYDKIVRIIQNKGGLSVNNDENVSKVLKRKREKLGLSMQEVSNLTGISISHISRIEKGVRLPGYKIFE